MQSALLLLLLLPLPFCKGWIEGHRVVCVARDGTIVVEAEGTRQRRRVRPCGVVCPEQQEPRQIVHITPIGTRCRKTSVERVVPHRSPFWRRFYSEKNKKKRYEVNASPAQWTRAMRHGVQTFVDVNRVVLLEHGYDTETGVQVATLMTEQGMSLSALLIRQGCVVDKTFPLCPAAERQAIEQAVNQKTLVEQTVVNQSLVLFLEENALFGSMSESEQDQDKQGVEQDAGGKEKQEEDDECAEEESFCEFDAGQLVFARAAREALDATATL